MYYATSGQGAVHAVSSHEEEETDQMRSMQTESSQSVNTQPEPVQSVFPETKFNNARTSTSSATKSMQTLPMSNNPPAEKGQSHLKKENESTLTNNQGTAKTASYGEKEETASVTRNGNKSPSNVSSLHYSCAVPRSGQAQEAEPGKEAQYIVFN
eukprot:Em0001g3542a